VYACFIVDAVPTRHFSKGWIQTPEITLNITPADNDKILSATVQCRFSSFYVPFCGIEQAVLLDMP
jgi:hypothetical protein